MSDVMTPGDSQRTDYVEAVIASVLAIHRTRMLESALVELWDNYWTRSSAADRDNPERDWGVFPEDDWSRSGYPGVLYPFPILVAGVVRALFGVAISDWNRPLVSDLDITSEGDGYAEAVLSKVPVANRTNANRNLLRDMWEGFWEHGLTMDPSRLRSWKFRTYAESVHLLWMATGVSIHDHKPSNYEELKRG